MHVWFIGIKGHFGEIAGKSTVRPFFSSFGFFFCLVGILGTVLGFNPLAFVDCEVLNVGGWLTHWDLALEAGVDFLAVVEHRLIPARVRSEWARLRRKGMASIWAPASQDSSHVGNAGVGVISMKGAPLALPTFATAQFRRFLITARSAMPFTLMVLVGLCTSCRVIRVLILILSSLL